MYRLPLFPLPLVLFPGAPLPLHVFEPRYRQMVAHCLEGDRRFGLVYHDPDRDGPFTVEQGRVGCVAEIVQFQPIPDGRSLMITRGLERFLLDDGIESDSMYFEALVDDYPDHADPGPEAALRGQRTLSLFGRVLERIAEEPQPVPPIDEAQPVSFQIAQWIRIDPAWQQSLLEMRSELERLDQVDALFARLLEQE